MKLHINSAISDVKSGYMYMVIKYFYLKKPIRQGQIHYDPYFNDTTRICRKYNIPEKAHNGYIYARVTKGM